MGSQTLALFFRALRVDVRLLHSHIMRLGLLGFVLVTLLWTQIGAFAMGAPGLIFFWQISYINLAFATLSGPLLFATCITEEKEEQTLGLLRMANVGPLSLLLGKLAPRLASALLILAVQFPFTLLAITLGGVTWGQVFAVFWTLLAHTFLVANIGLLCSVVAPRTSSAVGLAIILLLAHILAPGLGYAFFLDTIPPPGAVLSDDPLAQFVATAHPYGLQVMQEWYHATATWQLYNILTTGFSGAAVTSQQVISNFAGGMLLFAAGWLLFDIFNRNVDAAAGGSVRSLGDLLRRRGRRAIRAWPAALIGREFRFGVGGYGASVVKLLTYGPLAYLGMAFMERDFRNVDAADFGELLMVLATFVALPLESIILASRLYRTELKERTWSTLCMLPWTLPGVAYSKLAGTALALFPTVFYFGLGAMLDPDGLRGFFSDMNEPEAIVAAFVIVAQFVLVLHLVTWFSILTNSWTGVLLALLTWFGGLWLWYLCIVAPLVLQIITLGSDQEIYMIVANTVLGWGVLAIAALLHWNIGSRLRSAAAA